MGWTYKGWSTIRTQVNTEKRREVTQMERNWKATWHMRAKLQRRGNHRNVKYSLTEWWLSCWVRMNFVKPCLWCIFWLLCPSCKCSTGTSFFLCVKASVRLLSDGCVYVYIKLEWDQITMIIMLRSMFLTGVTWQTKAIFTRTKMIFFSLASFQEYLHPNGSIQCAQHTVVHIPGQ